MVKVFISYSRKDREFADQLVARLEGEGYDVWIDRFDGTPSGSWWDDICRNIDQAEHVIFIMSPPALASAVCQLELAHALKQGKHLIPVAHEPVEPKIFMGEFAVIEPDSVVREMLAGRDLIQVVRVNWNPLRQINRIQFYDPDNSIQRIPFEDACQRLLEALRRDEEHIQIHTRLGNQARLWESKSRKADLLLFGEEIDSAEQWLLSAESRQPQPITVHYEYIEASRIAETDRRAERANAKDALDRAQLTKRLAQRATRIALTILFIAVAGVLIAIQQLISLGNQATSAQLGQLASETRVAQADSTLSYVMQQVQNAEDNIVSLNLASNASEIINAPNGNAELATLLGIRALQASYTVLAEEVLVEASEQTTTESMFQDGSSIVYSATFSPDGRSVLTACEDNVARVWDVTSGDVKHVLSGHTGSVRSAVYSPDGNFILTASLDGTARIWDTSSGKLLYVLDNQESGVTVASYSASGNAIVTAGLNGRIRLWDSKGNPVITFAGHTSRIVSAVFSPDEMSVLTASWDGTARVWSLSKDMEGIKVTEQRTISGHTDWVTSAIYSPDGMSIVTTSMDGTVRIWDSRDATVADTTISVGTGALNAQFSPDGDYLVVATISKMATLWDVSGRLLKSFIGHNDWVTSATYNSDGTHILTSSDDGTTRIWEMINRDTRVLLGHSDVVNSVAYDPTGQYIVTSSNDNTAQIWNVTDHSLMQTLNGHNGRVLSAEFSPDGNHVLTAGEDNTVCIWAVASGDLVRNLSWGDGSSIVRAVYSADGGSILTAHQDGTFRIWDALGALIKTVSSHNNKVSSALFSPDGRSILTASFDTTVRMWDTLTGQMLQSWELQGTSVNQAIFGPDGSIALNGVQDDTISILDSELRYVIRVMTGHTAPIVSMAFSPNGKTLASTSHDSTIRLWNVEDGITIRVLNGHQQTVNSVAYSPDGRFIVTGSNDGTVRIWDADYHDFIAYACTRVFRDLTPEERQRYGIALDAPATCPQFATEQNPAPVLAPTWTPIPTQPIPVWTPIASPTP